jgi:serine/threonine protein phosphatase PrpC
VLVRGNTAVQLSEDHVPDNEAERTRIETYNPNPRLPLVRYVGGTWRVGGLLALSRAFGDAYLKGSDQFEGVSFYASDSYQSGFGGCRHRELMGVRGGLPLAALAACCLLLAACCLLLAACCLLLAACCLLLLECSGRRRHGSWTVQRGA